MRLEVDMWMLHQTDQTANDERERGREIERVCVRACVCACRGFYFLSMLVQVQV